MEQKIDQILRESLQEKTNYRIEFELERNKGEDLKKNINNLLQNISELTEENNSLKKIEQEKINAENLRTLTDIQNQRLLQVAKRHKVKMFKVVTTLVSIFLFIILMLIINI